MNKVENATLFCCHVSATATASEKFWTLPAKSELSKSRTDFITSTSDYDFRKDMWGKVDGGEDVAEDSEIVPSPGR